MHEIESLILLLAALLAQLIRLLTVLYPTLLVLRGFVQAAQHRDSRGVAEPGCIRPEYGRCARMETGDRRRWGS